MPDRSTALVLSGGVALGSYQAGVYEALAKEPGLSPAWIAGSSAGGAAGYIQTLGPRLSFSSFYDLAPTVAFLNKTIDFGRLNSGDIRFSVATTDIGTGDAVIFDTGKGDRIGIDHVMASCGFLPEFAPVEIAGCPLGDGSLSINAPVEPVLDEITGTDGTMIVADLFARDGARPVGLQAALARKHALMYGNQTWYRLDAWRRLWQRDLAENRLAPAVLYLSYHPVSDEAGPELIYDFSLASARDRWAGGFLDGRCAAARFARARPWPVSRPSCGGRTSKLRPADDRPALRRLLRGRAARRRLHRGVRRPGRSSRPPRHFTRDASLASSHTCLKVSHDT